MWHFLFVLRNKLWSGQIHNCAWFRHQCLVRVSLRYFGMLHVSIAASQHVWKSCVARISVRKVPVINILFIKTSDRQETQTDKQFQTNYEVWNTILLPGIRHMEGDTPIWSSCYMKCLSQGFQRMQKQALKQFLPLCCGHAATSSTESRWICTKGDLCNIVTVSLV